MIFNDDSKASHWVWHGRVWFYCWAGFSAVVREGENGGGERDWRGGEGEHEWHSTVALTLLKGNKDFWVHSIVATHSPKRREWKGYLALSLFINLMPFPLLEVDTHVSPLLPLSFIFFCFSFCPSFTCTPNTHPQGHAVLWGII